MKVKLTHTILILAILIFLFPVKTFAQLFGPDDEDLAKIEFELKKLNAHLENLKSTEITNLHGQQEDLLRQIEEIKQILPQLQGAIDQGKQETLSKIERTNTKLNDLEAEVKHQVLGKIHQQNKTILQQNKNIEIFREGLSNDMEKLGDSNKTNFQDFSRANQETLGKVVQQLEAQSSTTKKGFEDTISLFRNDVIPTIAAENDNNRQTIQENLRQGNNETQKSLEAFFTKNQQVNQKLREILQESLKQGAETKSLLDAIKKDQEITYKSLEGANQNISGNRSAISETKKAVVLANKNLFVADEKNNKLADSLKALQAQNQASSQALSAIEVDLKNSKEFNKLADEKFSKLIDLSSELAVHSTELENSVIGQLKDSEQKEDNRSTKVDLANEKLSRLIEILKTNAQEQAKLDPVAATLSKMQKEHAELKKSYEEIKAALGDLRRKANVNISRNDDIKKTLGQLKSTKKRVGKK